MSDTIKSTIKKDEPYLVWGKNNLTETQSYLKNRIGFGVNVIENSKQTNYLPTFNGSGVYLLDKLRIDSQYSRKVLNDQVPLSHKFMIKKEVNPAYNDYKSFLSDCSCMNKCVDHKFSLNNPMNFACNQCFSKCKL